MDALGMCRSESGVWAEHGMHMPHVFSTAASKATVAWLYPLPTSYGVDRRLECRGAPL